ncbi:PREDICTED: uclacyanin-3-like [Ipomoea nil]|uniref:uclacyanin-3-like n=1 Tax=Ipomoea nil TaxID=35883 RepID=UPI000900EB04|nr:PREDICTED: uclacyanin-3-like [Ipomoea nil]
MAMATFVLLFLLLASPAAFAKDHIVGGDGGWSQSGDYTTWAASETFTVGDSLVFNYGGSHGVDEVSKDDYDNCNAGNALRSFTDGKTTIKLSKAGPMYFMCPSFGHCQTGMKLAINVQSGSSSTPAGGSPRSSGTTPSTPSDSDSPPSTPTPAGKSSPNGAVVSSGGIFGFSLALGALLALMS